MDIEVGPLLHRTIWGPAILSTAIIFPIVFYSSYTTRLLTFSAIAASVVWALQPHDIHTPSTSYLFGFAPAWTLIVAVVFLLLSNPPRDFRRIRRKIYVDANEKSEALYEWEPFPESLAQRWWWTLDLLINFRGLGWSYQKRQHWIPDAVKKVYEESGIHVVRDGPGETRSTFLVKQCWYFVMNYLLLDWTIYFMDRDPWFNRNLGSDERLLFGHPSGNYILVRAYRVFIGTLATYSVMDSAHVVLAFISVSLGPRWLGTSGEPWTHPPLWGDPRELCHRGLLGFWGNFWHDLFRFQFLAITRTLIPFPDPAKRSTHSARGFLAMTLIFALSGSMHAAGSYAELRETAPLWLFAGFAVQSVGIALQEMITIILVRLKIPKGVQKVLLTLYWLSWGWLMAPIVLGDMAACGLFQAKVLPFSFVNAFWK